MADQQGSFDDHEAIDAAIKRMKVAELRQTLKDFNDLQDGIARWLNSGLKRDIADRVRSHMTMLKQRNQISHYLRAKAVIEKYYGSKISQGHRSAARRPAYASWQAPPQALGAAPAYTFAERYPSYYPNNYVNGGGASGSAQQSVAAYPSQPMQLRWPNFRASPFYEVKGWLAQQEITPLPRNPDAKLQSTLRVVFLEQHLQLLKDPSMKIRLFCAPHTAFLASSNPAHPASVEFPIHTDVRVNETPLSVNLRGKKTPAKVLPPDLNKDNRLNMRTSYTNRIDLQCQKIERPYIMAAAICKSRTAESLAEDLRKNKVKSKEAVLSDMKRAAEDDDIEVGDAEIGLKCPLSYMRLQVPTRSDLCFHTQCFDALSFFSINEQTPTWQCPTCQKSIDVDKLFLDGYMLDILQRVPEDVETVTIDNQGRWRTSDGNFRSDDTAAAQNGASVGATSGKSSGASPQSNGVPRVKGEDEEATSTSTTTPVRTIPSRQQKEIEVLDLDDDDDDVRPPSVPIEGRKDATSAQSEAPTISPSVASKMPSNGRHSDQNSMQDSSSTRAHAVIDLTLSDSDDDESVPPPLRSAPTRLLAPLPPAPPRAGLFEVPSRVVNGAQSSAWQHIDRLSANNAARGPIYGGTFGPSQQAQRSASSLDSSAFLQRASATGPSPASSNSVAACGDDQSATSAHTSMPAPPRSGFSLASRLGQQVADPYEYVTNASTSAASAPQARSETQQSHVDDDNYDDSMPILRARKRVRRNSLLQDEEEDDQGANGAAQRSTPNYEDELRDINFDDYELELDADAGLAGGSKDADAPALSNGITLAERLGAPTQASSTNSDGVGTVQHEPVPTTQSRNGSESSEGLYEDERAGLLTAKS